MSTDKFVNMARLMRTYNLQVDHEVLPDDMRCVKCKLVVKNACQGPCTCRLCRCCIDDLRSNGDDFCPGDSGNCGESDLSLFVTDYRANQFISELTVKCPNNECLHQGRLANMEDHLRVCQTETAACPFNVIGCSRDKLGLEEMSGHLQHENRSHCELLIEIIVNINNEMAALRQSEEVFKKKIGVLERKEDDHKREIEMLKLELGLKDEQIKTIKEEVGSIKDENISIKKENENFVDQLRILSEKIEREINERCKINEQDRGKMMEHVAREIGAITAVIGSNEDKLGIEMKSVKDDIRSINQDTRSMKDDIYSIKSQMHSTQVPGTATLVDASCEWVIYDHLGLVKWNCMDRSSQCFTGAVHRYNYRLTSLNTGGTARGAMWIHLNIHPGPSDRQLAWPFRGTVTVTVMDMSTIESCKSSTQECSIDKPSDYHHSSSFPFTFSHSELMRAGLDLSRGVRVSCQIVPSGAGR